MRCVNQPTVSLFAVVSTHKFGLVGLVRMKCGKWYDGPIISTINGQLGNIFHKILQKLLFTPLWPAELIIVTASCLDCPRSKYLKSKECKMQLHVLFLAPFFLRKVNNLIAKDFIDEGLTLAFFSKVLFKENSLLEVLLSIIKKTSKNRINSKIGNSHANTLIRLKKRTF